MIIWTNLKLSAEGRRLLLEGIHEHELFESVAGSNSVLADAEHDESIHKADILLGQPLPDDVLSHEKLQWLQITTAGYSRYDTPEFRRVISQKGIAVTNSSSVYDLPCAEHVLAFILAQSRNLPAALAGDFSNGTEEWNALRDGCTSLAGQKLIILGYGAIGEVLAGFLISLGLEIIGVRRRPTGRECVPTVALDALPELLQNADHIVSILPESNQTLRFVDSEFLDNVKKDAVFYNVGRGTTVDQDALANALRSGTLKSAWLDVTDPEPLPEDHILRRTANCYITPHTAGGHKDESLTVIRHFLKNLNRFDKGEDLVDRIM